MTKKMNKQKEDYQFELKRLKDDHEISKKMFDI